MNAHRSIGFLAAALVTVAQALVFAADTAAVAQNSSDRDHLLCERRAIDHKRILTAQSRARRW